jgi:hypothetical protein
MNRSLSPLSRAKAAAHPTIELGKPALDCFTLTSKDALAYEITPLFYYPRVERLLTILLKKLHENETFEDH